MDDEQTDYYTPCVRDYRSVDNSAAINEWFVKTEPASGLPKHTTILNVTTAEAIMGAFITRLKTDVYRNVFFGWRKGTPLPNPKAFIQPLAEITSPPPTLP